MEVLCLFCLLAFYTNPVVGVQSDSSRIYRITDKTSSEKGTKLFTRSMYRCSLALAFETVYPLKFLRSLAGIVLH